MTASEDVIDKVRKLLRLAQSANPHEAGLALERALQLAAKHKIDVSGLDLDPDIERIIHERFPVGQRLSYIKKLTLPIVRDFFNVEVVVSRPDVIFAGTVTDVAIASYVFGFLTASCHLALRAFEGEKKRRPSVSRRENYIAGWIYGVRSQLQKAAHVCELEDSRTALAISSERKRREAHMATVVGRTSQIEVRTPRRNESAVVAGYRRGRDTAIRTPLNPAPEVLRLQ